MPLILDKDFPDLFKDEKNLTAFEILVARNNKIDLKSRIQQSKRFNFQDQIKKEQEENKEGSIFYKKGEWFIKKWITPQPYEVINKIILGSKN